MSRIESLREKARKNRKKIILPEGNDPRIIRAAFRASRANIADIILFGDISDIRDRAKVESCKLDKIEVIDTKTHDGIDSLAKAFYELRKHKGLSEEDARKHLLKDPVYFAAMMVRLDMADGFVAGARNTTRNVARAAIHCLGVDKKIGTVSSSFVIELKDSLYGDNGLFVFGDCGIVPEPSSEQLAGIAVSCGWLIQDIFDVTAKVALLSYSTKGSGKGESVDKVKEALKLIKEKDPQLIVDGELQVDSAIIPEVSSIKCPDSKVAGKANVLVFPNLDAGNIAYKLTQRLGNARVVGPILQGVRKPASDLSRGCGVKEIVDAITITVIRAQCKK